MGRPGWQSVHLDMRIEVSSGAMGLRSSPHLSVKSAGACYRSESIGKVALEGPVGLRMFLGSRACC